MTSSDFVSSARRTIELEAEAVSALVQRVDGAFTLACQAILECRGRTIVTGMGKSGHIGKKIAATFASTGTPAFFVHPGEASHGDLGMITGDDLVIAISYSGNSQELLTLLPLFKRQGIPLIAMTGKPRSPLALESNIVLDVSVACEACPLALAPTSSTTAALVMGDALAIALLEARGFTAEDFAFSHPGGTLGRKLLLRVGDIMHSGDAVPRVSPDVTLSQALVVMTQKGFGITTVVDDKNQLLGVFTDGDLRRTIDRGGNFASTPIGDLMHANPKTVSPQTLAAEALNMMETARITALIVVDENKHPRGVLHMHDLLRAGVM